MKPQYAAFLLGLACLIAQSALAGQVTLTWQHQWTHAHRSKSAAKKAEILARDEHGRFWVVGTGGVDILDSRGRLVKTIDLRPHGTPNSIAIKADRAAVAITAPVHTDPGKVIFFSTRGTKLREVVVGANPDMVVFTPDGRLLVANEGEPSKDGRVDPVGSISLIDARYQVSFVSFDSYTGQESQLRRKGVRLAPEREAARDLEPEYLAVSPDGRTLYASLQENNTVAVVDLDNERVTGLLPLGSKDHQLEGNGLDASDRDGQQGNIRPWPVRGFYMPDAIAAYQVGGKTCLVTANEGDGREEERRVSELTLDALAFPNANKLRADERLGRLKVSFFDGDRDGDGDHDALYAYGARSLSIRDGDGALLWDSGDFIERYLLKNRPDLLEDDRSDNKGPKPEGLALLKVHGNTLVFLGLERASGIMAFDVTRPASPTFLGFLSHKGDRSPEGLLAYEQPDGSCWLAVANESSNTTTLYRLDIRSVPTDKQ